MALGRWNGQGSLPLSRIPCELDPGGKEALLPYGLEVFTVGRKRQPALSVSRVLRTIHTGSSVPVSFPSL